MADMNIYTDGNPYLGVKPKIKEKTAVPKDDWEIEETGRGTFDIRRNRRPYRYDRDSFEEAVMEVERAGATEITMVHLDGYRTRVRVGRR